MNEIDAVITKLRRQFEGSGSFGAPIFELCDAYEQLRSETMGPPASATQLRECVQQRKVLQTCITILQGLLEKVNVHLAHAPFSEYEKWNDDNADLLSAIEDVLHKP